MDEPEVEGDINLDRAALEDARERLARLDSELGFAHVEIARLRAELDEERTRRAEAEARLDDLWHRVEQVVRNTPTTG